MRGARRLGALFLCVTSVVAALEGDESAALKTRVNAVDGNVIVDVAEGKFSDEEKVSMLKKMFSNGFVATVDSDGNPIIGLLSTCKSLRRRGRRLGLAMTRPRACGRSSTRYVLRGAGTRSMGRSWSGGPSSWTNPTTATRRRSTA